MAEEVDREIIVPIILNICMDCARGVWGAGERSLGSNNGSLTPYNLSRLFGIHGEYNILKERARSMYLRLLG